MMKHHCHILYLFLILIAFVVDAEAKSSHIPSRIERLFAEFDIPSLCVDSCVSIAYKGYPVIIERKDKEITHIGLDIFGAGIKGGSKKHLYRFIEQYLLELLTCQSESIQKQRMRDDGVMIMGDLKDIPFLSSQENISLSELFEDSRGYTIEWSNNKSSFSISFPSRYELIFGISKIELENRFIKHARAHTILSKNDARIAGDTVRISEDLYIVKNGFYILEQMECSRFLTNGKRERKDSISVISEVDTAAISIKQDAICLLDTLNCINNKEASELYNEIDTLSLVCDVKYPIESLRNLLSASSIQNDYIIEVKVNKYGFNQEIINIPLSQLIDFCLQDGCIPYIGIENAEDEKIAAVLTMVQPYYGYNHVFRIEFNPKTLTYRSGVINSVAKIYIPTDNVSSLFGERL